MNTAEFDTRLRYQPRDLHTEPLARAATTTGVPITVLTTDPDLCAAISTAAGDQYPVSIAASMEEAVRLGAKGQCAILITDQALSQQSLVSMSGRMRTYDPASIMIVVGSRGDDQALIGLLSSAVVERFMSKPVTPALARVVLRSAASEYQSLQSRNRREAKPEEQALREGAAPRAPERASATVIPLPGIERTAWKKEESKKEEVRSAPPTVIAQQADPTSTAVESRPGSAKYRIAAAVAAVVVGGAVWWAMQQRMPDIDPRRVIATNLAAGSQALTEGRYAEPPQNNALHYYGAVLALDPENAAARRGVGEVANSIIEGVKLGIVEGRLAEAGIALERVRRIDPANPRLPVLDAELRQEQANQLRMLQSHAQVVEALKVVVAPLVGKSSQGVKETPRRSKPAGGVPMTTALVEQRSASESVSQVIAPRVLDVNDPLALGPPAPASAAASEQADVVAPIASAAVGEPASGGSGTGSNPAPATVAPAMAEPRLIAVVQPDYPSEARMRGVEGWVDLTLAVTASGQVSDAHIEADKNGRWFGRAALTAVRQWRYEARSLPGGTATQPVRVRVQFKLEK